MAPLHQRRSIVSAARYRDSVFVVGGTDGYNTLDSVEQTRIMEGVRTRKF
jgi:hypothetical protein